MIPSFYLTISDKSGEMVSKNHLYFLAAFIWMAVSLMLLNFARVWLGDYSGEYGWVFILAGLLLGLIKYYLVFRKMADKNLKRIREMNNRIPIYRLYSSGTYILIIVMMAAGILFRKAGWPRECLASIDIAIGLGLFFGAIRFYRSCLNLRKQDS